MPQYRHWLGYPHAPYLGSPQHKACRRQAQDGRPVEAPSPIVHVRQSQMNITMVSCHQHVQDEGDNRERVRPSRWTLHRRSCMAPPRGSSLKELWGRAIRLTSQQLCLDWSATADLLAVFRQCHFI